MRTTLNIDDDLLLMAKRLSSVQGKSLGRTISDLIRAGLQSDTETVAFPKFSVSPNAEPLTMEMVQRQLEEQ